MESSFEGDAPHFHNPETAPLSAIVDRQLFEQHDAVSYRVQLQVVLLRRQIVQQYPRCLRPEKKCFSAKIWRRYRKGLCASSRSSDRLSMTIRAGASASTLSKIICVVSLSSILPGCSTVIPAWIKSRLRRNQLEDRYALQRPAMALRHKRSSRSVSDNVM